MTSIPSPFDLRKDSVFIGNPPNISYSYPTDAQAYETMPTQQHLQLNSTQQGRTAHIHSDSTAHKKSGASSNRNEDWTKISDPTERRRMQNRIAKRKYRTKQKRKLEDIKSAVKNSKSSDSTQIQAALEETREAYGTGQPQSIGKQREQATHTFKLSPFQQNPFVTSYSTMPHDDCGQISSLQSDTKSVGAQQDIAYLSNGRTVEIRRDSALKKSSAPSAPVDPNEDWTKTSDLAERRRIQNRIAQRKCREKRERKLQELKKKARNSSNSAPSQATSTVASSPEMMRIAERLKPSTNTFELLDFQQNLFRQNFSDISYPANFHDNFDASTRSAYEQPNRQPWLTETDMYMPSFQTNPYLATVTEPNSEFSLPSMEEAYSAFSHPTDTQHYFDMNVFSPNTDPAHHESRTYDSHQYLINSHPAHRSMYSELYQTVNYEREKN